jgi:hypothetical protein
MSTTTFSKEWVAQWNPDDPRLLRAAQKIIRLYDLGEINLYSARPESLAKVIARELNDDAKKHD